MLQPSDEQRALLNWFERFASKQIRQQATIGGNIVNASPIGDGPPVFLALQASVELSSVSGSRVIPLSEFFVGYKKTALGADEVLTGIIIPPRENEQTFAALKVSKRKDRKCSSEEQLLAMHADWARPWQVERELGLCGSHR